MDELGQMYHIRFYMLKWVKKEYCIRKKSERDQLNDVLCNFYANSESINSGH